MDRETATFRCPYCGWRQRYLADELPDYCEKCEAEEWHDDDPEEDDDDE